MTSQQALWGKVEFVAVPIGHAGTTLVKTHQSLAQAIAATRPEIERSRTRRHVINPDTDSAVRNHDTTLFKPLMRTLTKLAQTRLVGIIHNPQSLVNAQVGVISRTQAHLDATPAHTEEPRQQGGDPTNTTNARTASPGEHRDHIGPDNSISMPLHHLPHRIVQKLHTKGVVPKRHLPTL